MINPNDPIIANPNDPTAPQAPAMQPQPKTPTIPTPPSAPDPSIDSAEGFDIDAALEAIEEATPTPDPEIKVNPRHATPSPAIPTVTPRSSTTPPTPQVSHVAPVAPAPSVPTPNTPTVPSHPSAAKQAVHKAFGVAPTTPASIGPQKPPQPRIINTKKKGKRIGIVGYAIGCGLFALILLIGIAGILYSMFQNPNQSRNLIPRDDGIMLLKVCAGIIFGTLILFGTFFILINLLRIAQKNKKNTASYVGGMLLGLVLVGVGFGGGIPSISMLKQLESDTISTGQAANPFLLMGGNTGLVQANTNTSPAIIAPAKVLYQLDETKYKAIIASQNIQQVSAITLDCGNEQTFSINYNKATNKRYFGPCFYAQKGSYEINIYVDHTDTATGEKTRSTLPLNPLNITSNINISINNGTNNKAITLNENQNELMGGEAPAKIIFDAQSIISDFQLKTNNIEWDMDGDGTFERTEDVLFSHNFLRSQLHTVGYRLPDISPYIYTFDIRIQQSSTPVCSVVATSQGSMSYNLDIQFLETNTKINEYAFEIIDRTTSSKIDTKRSSLPSLSYDFIREGLYAVKVYFITDDGSKGSCQSDDFRVGSIPYQINYQTTIQGPDEKTPTPIAESAIATLNKKTITLTAIPTTIAININDIIPRSDTITPIITLDNTNKISPDGSSFTISINENKTQKITIGVRDTINNKTTNVETYTINIALPDAEGKLLISPDNVGNEPFDVTLDASTITLNDPDDEVVYFSRDFGDGKNKKNQSQGKIGHTYYFDSTTEQGIYEPTATVTTRKGRTLTLRLDDPVIVKRSLRHGKVIFESHPAQLARVGDSVDISLTVDGIPSKIMWDFGDTKTLECKSRSCTSTTHTFNKAGSYTVTATVSYDDHPDVVAKSKIVIQ